MKTSFFRGFRTRTDKNKHTITSDAIQSGTYVSEPAGSLVSYTDTQKQWHSG